MINICDIPPDESENTRPNLSMLSGNSEALIILNDEYIIGRYQSILLLEIDGPRERTLAVKLLSQFKYDSINN